MTLGGFCLAASLRWHCLRMISRVVATWSRFVYDLMAGRRFFVVRGSVFLCLLCAVGRNLLQNHHDYNLAIARAWRSVRGVVWITRPRASRL